METKLQRNGLSVAKLTLTAAICLFGLLSIVYVKFTTNAMFSYFYCLATIPFALLPVALTLCFRWKFNFLFYAFFSVYTLGPLIGGVYNVYYFTTWFDDILHTMAGTVFAVVGAYLALALNKHQKISPLLSALFGLLFSIGIAVVWEFFEFGSDMLFSSDMQADTVITTVVTKINRTDGSVDVFQNIKDTVVNGESLGVNGYLDIGLIDTVVDMLVETIGALVYFVYAIIDRDRHPLISLLPRNKA